MRGFQSVMSFAEHRKLQDAGKRGQGCPSDTSQREVPDDVKTGFGCALLLVPGNDTSKSTSSFRAALYLCGSNNAAMLYIREKASATVFSTPETGRISVENCEI